MPTFEVEIVTRCFVSVETDTPKKAQAQAVDQIEEALRGVPSDSATVTALGCTKTAD